MTEQSGAPQLPAEQDKLFALARAARARVGAPEGAAVVDETGRTYSAASVALPHLELSAVALAAATAAAAGASALHGCVVVGASPTLRPGDREVFSDLAAPGALLLGLAPDRTATDRWSAP